MLTKKSTAQKEKRQVCRVLIDRLQILSWAEHGRKPPRVRGFKVVNDRFVRSETTIKTYARVREYVSKTSRTRIFWQYRRQRAFLKPWKITIIADDLTGISADEIDNVIRHCRFHRILLVELAIDFRPGSGIDLGFVKRHALFGKSRRDSAHGGPGTLRYGTRKSPKLVRVYFKKEIAKLRVELELHSAILKSTRVQLVDDLSNIDGGTLERHLAFVRIEVRRLRRYLIRRFGRDGKKVLKRALSHSGSIHTLARYLRRAGVANVHRFFKPLKRLNAEIYHAITEWSWSMQSVFSGDERK